MKRIIDTHIHVWDLEKAAYTWLTNDASLLNITYSIEQLTPHLSKAGVTQGILVQAANNFEDTDMMLEVAAETDWVTGVVGWLPLMDPEATEEAITKKYLKNTYFKGCRHLIHNEANAKWLMQDQVIESLKILDGYHLTYDVVGTNTDHLKTAIQVAEKLPGLKLVLDHLNQPPIVTKEKYGVWGEMMKEAAQYKNLHVKISGLGTTAGNGGNWTKDDLKPYIMHVLELFGTSRCFCGGDWPICLLAGTYEKAWLAYRQIFSEEFTPDEQEQLLYKNAASFYHLL